MGNFWNKQQLCLHVFISCKTKKSIKYKFGQNQKFDPKSPIPKQFQPGRNSRINIRTLFFTTLKNMRTISWWRRRVQISTNRSKRMKNQIKAIFAEFVEIQIDLIDLFFILVYALEALNLSTKIVSYNGSNILGRNFANYVATGSPLHQFIHRICQRGCHWV